MGKVMDWLTQDIRAERDKWIEEAITRGMKIVSLEDRLAAMHVRAIAAETKLIQRQEPAPLEPVTIKVGTAADVRRIMAEQSRKDLEDTDGIR